MIRIATDKLKSGMIIARTVIGFEGKTLFARNTKLTDLYISRLIKLGVGSIYIKDGLDDFDIPEIVSEEVKLLVSSTLSKSFKKFSLNKSLNIESYKKSVNILLENILSNRNHLIQLEDLHMFNDYIFTHSINVAIYAMMTGMSMGYTESKLAELGLGALLHDIGMVATDPNILNSPEVLTKFERYQIEKHPEIGFKTLKAQDNISSLVAHVAYQHHERIDGSGYPRGLKDENILQYAKIVAVVDTFDAIISDRPYRPGSTTTDALMMIKELSGKLFDPEVVQAFNSNIALYPVGCLVNINTGYIAVVTSVTRYNFDQPVINVIMDEDGILIKPPLEINLNHSSEVRIVKRLNYEEAEFIRNKINPDLNLFD